MRRVAKMLESWWSAASWLSLAGESGEAGDGYWRTRMRFLAADVGGGSGEHNCLILKPREYIGDSFA
jgi:hypothetical protein